MNITELTVHELQEKIKNKELTITEINEAYVKQIKEKEPEVQAFITELTEQGMEQAEKIQERIARQNEDTCKFRVKICTVLGVFLIGVIIVDAIFF